MSTLATPVLGYTAGGNINLETPSGYIPIGLCCKINDNTTAPAMAYIKGDTLYVRSTSTYGVTVRVTFAKIMV